MTTATIEISREAGHHQDRLRAYKVLIDGQVVGKVRAGETVSFDVDPGSHTVRLAIDFAGSQHVQADVDAGRTARFRARPAGRNVLLMLMETLVHRDRWVVLEPQT